MSGSRNSSTGLGPERDKSSPTGEAKAKDANHHPLEEDQGQTKIFDQEVYWCERCQEVLLFNFCSKCQSPGKLVVRNEVSVE